MPMQYDEQQETWFRQQRAKQKDTTKLKNKQLKELYERFAYAEYMVANGCPRKDFLEDEEIDFLLSKYLNYLIACKRVQPYQPPLDN